MQSTECQSYLNQSKVDICATLWRIYNLSGVYTDVGCNYKKQHMPIRITIIAFLILFNQGLFSQTFLRDYEKYRIDKLDSIKESRKGKGLKTSANWIKQYKLNLNQQIKQFQI